MIVTLSTTVIQHLMWLSHYSKRKYTAFLNTLKFFKYHQYFWK